MEAAVGMTLTMEIMTAMVTICKIKSKGTSMEATTPVMLHKMSPFNVKSLQQNFAAKCVNSQGVDWSLFLA